MEKGNSQRGYSFKHFIPENITKGSAGKSFLYSNLNIYFCLSAHIFIFGYSYLFFCSCMLTLGYLYLYILTLGYLYLYTYMWILAPANMYLYTYTWVLALAYYLHLYILTLVVITGNLKAKVICDSQRRLAGESRYMIDTGGSICDSRRRFASESHL